jgi:hypothetical protein
VLRYAVAVGKTTSNSARDIKGALRPSNPRHFPAITDPKRFGEPLRACDKYTATPVVRAALKLAPMLADAATAAGRASVCGVARDRPRSRDVTGHAKMVFRGERPARTAQASN